ncbi:PIN domain-containing protein [Candidatus Thiosymbion oneisti]|uniref:PIN domain-containing protein n=1 Tax=Candidatus Thiosymbion oneisti TaxID=589554 RepID=UPI00159F003A|nr:PIN domain-containing protein [Candidatus Thiosymbion oneisti]
MASEISRITDYPFSASDELLLDTNVWLFNYAPHSLDDSRVAVYSQALADILAAKSRIYIDVLIVSEFINRYIQLKHKLTAPRTKLKEFRKSGEFIPVAREIADDMRRILGHCMRVGDGFDALDIDGLMNEYATGGSDFNDQVISELCRAHGLKLVTDDGGFGGRGIPLVTANKHLLD